MTKAEYKEFKRCYQDDKGVIAVAPLVVMRNLCHNKPEGNAYAKHALVVFRDNLIRCKCDKVYRRKTAYHTKYMNLMLIIQKAFAKGDYITACHEIHTLAVYEHLLQPHIYHNVLSLLNQYL